MLAMATQAEQTRDDKLWASPAPGALNGFSNCFQASTQISAIETVPGHAVAHSLIDQRPTGKLASARCRVGVLIVRNHKNERQFLDGSLVERFVERARRGASFPDARH